MTEFEALNNTHIGLREACGRHPLDRELEQLRQQVWGRLEGAQRRQALPLMFASPMPGYITVGRKGHTQDYPHPGHLGLDDAATIFWHGLTVTHTLRACDLVGPVKRPGNTLRNRLTEATVWVERVTGCHELARAMRSISISNDGRIAIEQHQDIELTAF